MCKLCDKGIRHVFCDGGSWRGEADPLCDRCLRGVPHKGHDKMAYQGKYRTKDHNRLVIHTVPRRPLPKERRQ